MDWIDQRLLAHQEMRFRRPDGDRFIRPDWRRFIRHDSERFFLPGACPEEFNQPYPKSYAQRRREEEETRAAEEELAAIASERDRIEQEIEQERLKIKSEMARLRLKRAWIQLRIEQQQKAYNPNQPRVPAGSREGGQWTDDGDSGRNDSRILSDVTPDNVWKPGAQYAQGRGGRRGGAGDGMGPGQAARLAVAEARAQDAIRRVRDIDPTWRPTPSSYQTPEGRIAAAEAEAREAEARLQEFARNGIGPGPYAGESIPARSPGRQLNSWERDELNRIGRETGCHTCGTFEPGTRKDNFVGDHQYPNALNPFSRAQRLYPHCLKCRHGQGGWTTKFKGRGE